MARTKFDYLDRKTLQTARELMASRNWQDSGKTSFVERIAVLQLMIDWGQGRHEAPEVVQEVISDLHIGSGDSGYSDSERINLILAYLAADHDADEVDEHGVRYAALYATLTKDGLAKLVEWLQAQPERAVPSVVNPADDNLSLHPNVRRALKNAGVTGSENISAVMSHARFRSNISGGRASDWIRAGAEALRKAGSAQALRQEDSEAAQMLNERASARR
jgi:hypothetical protein